jgi:hypothetical protein
MKKHELTELVFLLRLGLWSGGEVTGIGHVSAALPVAIDFPELHTIGTTGLWLGGGVMLESGKNNTSNMRGETGATSFAGNGAMTFSVFDPYTGGYNLWRVTTERDERPAELLAAIIAEAERERIFGRRLPREHVSLQSRRRHVAQFGNMRGGSLPTIRRR